MNPQLKARLDFSKGAPDVAIPDLRTRCEAEPEKLPFLR
jgi:hypothetical protein